jgi:hypothetical protein
MKVMPAMVLRVAVRGLHYVLGRAVYLGDHTKNVYNLVVILTTSLLHQRYYTKRGCT